MDSSTSQASSSSWQMSPHIDSFDDDISPELDVPPYTSSLPTPKYSFNPGPDEQRLALSSNSPHLHSSGSSVYSKTNDSSGFKLQLVHQGTTPSAPCYGRHAIIRGVLTPAQVETLFKVELELTSIIKVSIAEGGKKTQVLFKLVHTLWERDTIGAQPCPESIPFSIPLPSEYQESGSLRPLPPSFEVAYPGVPGLFAKCSFKLHIHIEWARKMLWSKKNTLTVPFKYYPRTRAPRPIVRPTLPFLSLLKIVPEDFLQVEELLPARPKFTVEPIRCHFFIPSSCIYALTDEIPFHIQLVGTASSISAFTKPNQNTHATTRHSHETIPSAGSNQVSGSTTTTATNSRPAKYNGSPLSIRVFIFRQVSVEIRGQKAWRTCVLGEGKLAPTSPTGPPPSFQTLDQRPNISSSSSCSRAQFSHDLPAPRYCTGCDGTALESLDWDGMVKVQSDTMGSDVGGFTAGRLAVKDFIVLSITPPDPPRNAFMSHQIAKPIRLVTDPLEDGWDG